MLAEFIAGLREDDDRPALPGVRRGELARLVRGYAVALAAEGLGAGDTVALAVRPGARSLATLLAAYHLGMRVAVVDPTAGPDVVRARLALAEPRLVLADSAAQAVAGWAAPLARRAHLALPSLNTIAPVRTIGRRLPRAAPSLRPAPGAFPTPYEGDGDAVVVFTSGTTSRPRAVVHTRASISAGMTAVRDLVRPVPGAPVLGGTFFVLLPSLAGGAPVAPPTRRNLRRLQPQAVYLTPPQVRAALAAGSRFDGARVYSGSAPVSASLLSAVRRAGAREAWGVYALTEVFPAAAVESAAKTAYSGSGDLVGELLPGVSGRVDDDGQLLLAGPTAAHRYLGSEPFSWVATGDIGRVSGRTVVLGGRAKDMILRRAENIYPGLYEPSLHVPGVELALLVGVPAEDGDERVVALVQTAEGRSEDDVRAALRGPLERMGSARPDSVVFGPVPVAGRSRKPDRAAASELAARLVTGAGRVARLSTGSGPVARLSTGGLGALRQRGRVTAHPGREGEVAAAPHATTDKTDPSTGRLLPPPQRGRVTAHPGREGEAAAAPHATTDKTDLP
ncbi:class I adenylate-forming enzyme family protein [Paractinoplanes brasiliensis]|uniref:Acyl-CoA synthetase (AMP-forming)/AMP-acid ligase II n=2 Tax=Paractinoplanes brasiliensis TaxID=52695 RepID=A0A4R6JZU3_9ACTN|nr:class I adenylate-forming enzyme family protein [Actinoplanes brasiliensis]TDO41452.1 acyl-CoA synthetase (AMP-forming)/AMP-acid ligase II [Actinoplanes brasiliensis]GID27263.1 fatty-acyl-CoA synthase [Actinoplanes brasiliensis]